MSQPVISVVIPVRNEEKNIRALFDRLKQTLMAFGRSFEIIFVNDASTDNSENILDSIFRENKNVAVVHLFKRSGKAVALERGFEIMRGEFIVTIDGDLQHEPEDIPRLIEKMEEGFDVVNGKRASRQDNRGKILTSRVFNFLMRLITGLKIDDYFSGLKCFRANVVRFLALYGDLYRFAAVFAYREGFKVAEIPVTHHSRAHGVSQYSPVMRFNLGVRDIITVLFSVTLSRKRVYYFGLASLFAVGLGLIFIFLALLNLGSEQFLHAQPFGLTGLILVFLGAEGVLLKKVADDFFTKHYEDFRHRQRNVKRWSPAAG